MDDIYGQPVGKQGYGLIDSIMFAYWLPVLKEEAHRWVHPWTSGYKVHLSAAPDDADRIARKVLPLLQRRRVDHKVVRSLDMYAQLNSDNQRGKFITIYPGPVLHSFTDLVNALDPVLAQMKAKPGPQTLDRESGHTKPEKRIGRSGLLSYITTTKY